MLKIFETFIGLFWGYAVILLLLFVCFVLHCLWHLVKSQDITKKSQKWQHLRIAVSTFLEMKKTSHILCHFIKIKYISKLTTNSIELKRMSIYTIVQMWSESKVILPCSIFSCVFFFQVLVIPQPWYLGQLRSNLLSNFDLLW